jgi:hypothetical protein
MSLVKIEGNASGTGVFTVASPNSNTDRTLTLPDNTGTVALTSDLPYALTSGTAVSASGTSVDFTDIPSWVKRITVMLYDISVSGTSNLIFRLGDSGGIEITGYSSGATSVSNTTANTTNGNGGTDNTSISAAGAVSTAASVYQGHCFMTQLDNTRWVISGSLYATSIGRVMQFAGRSSLTSTLDRIRITTANGTDTFDAGSINILYE